MMNGKKNNNNNNTLYDGKHFKLSNLQRELSEAVAKENTRVRVDSMKKRAIVSSGSYDEFRHLVACAEDNLTSLSRKEMLSLGESSAKKRSFGVNAAAASSASSSSVISSSLALDSSSCSSSCSSSGSGRGRRSRRRRRRVRASGASKQGPQQTQQETTAQPTVSSVIEKTSNHMIQNIIRQSEECALPETSAEFLRIWETMVRLNTGPRPLVTFACRVGGGRFSRLFRADLPVNVLIEMCGAFVSLMRENEDGEGKGGGTGRLAEEGEEGELVRSSTKQVTEEGDGENDAAMASLLRHVGSCGGFKVALAFMRTERKVRDGMQRLIPRLSEVERRGEEGGSEAEEVSLVELYSPLG